MKKKLFLFILSASLLMISCNNTNQVFLDKVKDADSVVINYFKGDGTMDTVVAVRSIRDKDKLTQLGKMIAAGPSSKEYKCGYDGSLHYFKKGMVLQDVDFRMNDVHCMHFSFLLNGTIQTSTLSAEAKQFIETVKK